MNQPAAKPSPPAAKPPPAAAKPPAAAAKPPQPAKPAVKKKGSGCLPLLIVIILIAAAGAAVYYYPQQVEAMSGIKLPSFIPSAASRAKKPAPVKEAPPDDPAPLAATTAPAPAPDNERMQALTTRVQQLQRAADSARQQGQEIQARLVRAEQQLARLAAQAAEINQRQGTSQLRLQVIALQLQLDGDTQAAATRLGDLAATTEDTAAARAMLDEVARLENMVSRQILLSLLEALRQPLAAPAATTGDGGGIGDEVVGDLKKLFNIRHTPTAAALPLAQDKLARLELLLLTRREDAYWRLLMQMRSDGGGAPRVRDILQRLHEYGAPDYQLRLTR